MPKCIHLEDNVYKHILWCLLLQMIEVYICLGNQCKTTNVVCTSHLWFGMVVTHVQSIVFHREYEMFMVLPIGHVCTIASFRHYVISYIPFYSLGHTWKHAIKHQLQVHHMYIHAIHTMVMFGLKMVMGL
jgi:hypothetical protein